MIQLVLDGEALSRVRLTYSPMWEVACSLRLLMHRPDHQLHASWLKWVRPRVESELVQVLESLMPSPHRFPDFLTPPPGLRPRSFQAELDEIATTNPAVARAQIEHCWRGDPPKTLHQLLRDETTLMSRLSSILGQYWNQALAPVWGNVRGLLSSDLAYRADEFATSGLCTMLDQLHPRISFDGRTLALVDPRVERIESADGLVLVSCAFVWPDVLIVHTPPHPVTIAYAPRGTGTLWQRRLEPRPHPAGNLIGYSRATILALLDFPLGTSQLAEHTRMSLPAVSQHLGVLRKSGLIEARRVGRTVLNTRTALGTALLDAANGI